MRRIHRESLPKRPTAFLRRKQTEVNRGSDPRAAWRQARKTKTMNLVAGTLARMSGKRQRCMFCGDSRGTDIDHFWPISPHKDRTFVWVNLLWVCAGCNRKKGDRFDLDDSGRPCLIDPTAEEPWDFLFYDSHTGILKAKYDPATGQPHPKGQYTTHPDILPLNIESLTEGRQRTTRNLRRAVSTFLARALEDRARLNKTFSRPSVTTMTMA
jgi:uncharacterized protein (TIGR02646 family)